MRASPCSVPSKSLARSWRTGYVWQPIGMPSGSARSTRAAANAAASEVGPAEELSSVEVHTDSGSQPLRYSRERYWLASGTLVILRFAASQYRRRRVRKATAYRFTASVMGRRCRKLPGDCAPPLQAASHWCRPGDNCPGSRGVRVAAAGAGVAAHAALWNQARTFHAESGENFALVADEHHALGRQFLAVFIQFRRAWADACRLRTRSDPRRRGRRARDT